MNWISFRGQGRLVHLDNVVDIKKTNSAEPSIIFNCVNNKSMIIEFASEEEREEAFNKLEEICFGI